MPETPSSPPPSPEQAPAPAIPPIDVNALLGTAMAVLRTPADFFKSKKDEKGFVKCLTFSIAAGVVHGVLRLLSWIMYGHSLGGGLRELVQAIVFGAIGPFIGGAIVWAISMIFGSKATYEPNVRIAAYGFAVMPVMGACLLVPWVGWMGAHAAALYGIYILVVGARTLNFEVPPAPTPTS
jgi:hypothetical protein